MDVPLLIGTSRDFFRVWVGPKLLMTWFHTDMTLSIPNDAVSVARFDGMVTYLGGQGGFALGYRKAFFAIELTVADSFGTARTSVSVHYETGRPDVDEDEMARNWYARVKSRPSFRGLLADRVPGMAPAGHYADLDF